MPAIHPFVPSREWQDVPLDAELPPGLEIELDMNTGTKRARLPPQGNGHGEDFEAKATKLEKHYQDNAPPPARRRLAFADHGAERLTGEPPWVQWLVEGTIPLGVPVLVAAMGDTGKSYLALHLCIKVAMPMGGDRPAPLWLYPAFGGGTMASGRAVFLTAEDSAAAVHRRLAVLDPEEVRARHPGRLIVIALPDAGGPMPFFVRDPKLGLRATDEWQTFCDECMAVEDLKLVVIDPLAAFSLVALDSDSADAQFVASQISSLAARTGATVMVLHHMRNAGEAPKTVSEARERIRGSSGLVDGGRCAYALWPPDEAEAKAICKSINTPFKINAVGKGAVVKANDDAKRTISTYIRSPQGLLIDRSRDVLAGRADADVIAFAIVDDIARAAKASMPFTVTGKSGVYEQHERLNEGARAPSRAQLWAVVRELIDEGRIVQCMAKGSTALKWLDVPGGPFARGEGEFKHGAEEL